MPDTILPMEPLPCGQIFDDPDFIYQVKWDGVRMLAYLENGRVRLINRRQHDRTRQYPELQLLTDHVKGKGWVLDGELVVMQEERPSFPAIMRRDNCRLETNIKNASRNLPVSYMIFDLIYHGNRDLRTMPLLQRCQLMSQVITPSPQYGFHLVENFASGTQLYQAVQLHRLEGVVAKKADSIYAPAKKHRCWYKIKYRRRSACVAGGYTTRGGQVNALLLGMYQDHDLIYVGKVGSGLNTCAWQQLNHQLPTMARQQSPFINLPGSLRKTAFFLEPLLIVDIEYSEWTPNLTLRSPVIKGFLNLRPEECLLQLS